TQFFWEKGRMKALILFFVLFIFCNAHPIINDDDEKDKLVFLQAVWRHGDRSPIETYKTDPYQEDSWQQGWGQLSPKGMEQHVYLGRNRLKARYIDELKFLSPYYNSHEIYVRSTDVNRTIASAMSNMFGMYGENARPGIDYPNCTGCWPTGFIPIAIHSVREDTDYTLNADAFCPRQTDLQILLRQTPEFKQMEKDQKALFDYISENAKEWIGPLEMWKIVDSLYIEMLYKKQFPDWVNRTWEGKPLFNVINDTGAIVEKWVNGLGLKPYKGIDFKAEASIIRGGTLLWSLIGHMQQKVLCLENPKLPQCTFFNKLKYYAYSAHDTTLAGLFSTLGFSKTNYNEDGYPRYSSCVTAELWKKSNGKFYVKFYYFPLGEDMEDVTPEIKGCSTPCSLKQLSDRSLQYKAKPDIEQVSF
uniref:Acid phosphatase n=1 Tax=Panagrolaimus sp. ES5 TaxID=591445 RepID=A0AC34FI71_9BILA